MVTFISQSIVFSERLLINLFRVSATSFEECRLAESRSDEQSNSGYLTLTGTIIGVDAKDTA